MDRAAERLAGLALAPVARGRSAAPPTDEALRARREKVLGSALESLSYARPLHLVRGSGAWMFDADGNAFLDAYNNVPVVGHAHPRVTDAIARQAALLNTNTRYLHGTIVELAERIVATMPEGLDTVMFVNSGSEANDLAWRLATIATGADAGLVTEWAYHGVTAAIVDFSPSEWPRGQPPDGVETFPAPDTYRGPLCRGSRAAPPWRGRTWTRPWPVSPSVAGGRPPCSWTRSSPPPASSRRIRRSSPPRSGGAGCRRAARR